MAADTKEAAVGLIKAIRKARGWSGAEVARAIGVSPSTITRALDENSKFVPSTKTILALFNMAKSLSEQASDIGFAVRDSDISKLARAVSSSGKIPVLATIKPGLWDQHQWGAQWPEIAPSQWLDIREESHIGREIGAFEIVGPSEDPEFITGTYVLCDMTRHTPIGEGDIVVARLRMHSTLATAYSHFMFDVFLSADKLKLKARPIPGSSAAEDPLPTVEAPAALGRPAGLEGIATVLGVVCGSYRRFPLHGFARTAAEDG